MCTVHSHPELQYLSFHSPSKFPSLVDDSSLQSLCRRGHKLHCLHAISLSETHTSDSAKEHCLPHLTSHCTTLKEDTVKERPLSLKYLTRGLQPYYPERARSPIKYLTRRMTTNKPYFTGKKQSQAGHRKEELSLRSNHQC